MLPLHPGGVMAAPTSQKNMPSSPRTQPSWNWKEPLGSALPEAEGDKHDPDAHRPDEVRTTEPAGQIHTAASEPVVTLRAVIGTPSEAVDQAPDHRKGDEVVDPDEGERAARHPARKPGTMQHERRCERQVGNGTQDGHNPEPAHKPPKIVMAVIPGRAIPGRQAALRANHHARVGAIAAPRTYRVMGKQGCHRSPRRSYSTAFTPTPRARPPRPIPHPGHSLAVATCQVDHARNASMIRSRSPFKQPTCSTARAVSGSSHAAEDTADTAQSSRTARSRTRSTAAHARGSLRPSRSGSR